MAEPFGPYRLERTINVGSIGEVFLARREVDRPSVHGEIASPRPIPQAIEQQSACGAPAGASDGEPLVVKRLLRELARRPEHVEMFIEEGRMARRLRHENLVRAFDAGTVEGVLRGPGRDLRYEDHYIAMELVAGPNLAQLAGRGPVPARAALRVAADLCAGLEHMHREGVVHCDVSPTNVLVGPDRALLTDFGAASRLGLPQRRVSGTVPYMSPEQARGLAVDARSDLFAVGVILWELLAGRPLFQRAAPYLTLAAVVEDPAPLLDGELAAIAPILARALAKNPDERQVSCAELGAALRDAASALA
jgi:serine/threonine protein kinase